MSYRIKVDPTAKNGLEFRGDNRKALNCKDSQFILAGPAETGKTFATLTKLHLVCAKYPNSQHAMVRKTYSSITGSCGKTWERIIKGAGVQVIGGSFPTRYIYPNGATVWVGGMDNPDKVLSAERDTIYVNQAEELTIDDWEMLSTRCTGRGSVVKHPQLYGDCNPSGSKHWIRQKAAAGKLTLLNAKHQDNPTLFTLEGQMTEQGKKSLASLDLLTGVRRKRLLEGIWATAEGAVYDMFDSQVHVTQRDPNEMVAWYEAMDEGYTNPQVNLLIGKDSDGRWHIFREYYVTQHLESEIVAQAWGWYRSVKSELHNLKQDKVVELVAVDAAAAGLIASLKAAGMNAVAGKGLIGGNGKVKGGIDKVQDMLKVQGDGRPRLTVDPSCINTINEFESYCWKPERDVPLDKDNHSMGAIRYLVDALNEPTGAFASASHLIANPSVGFQQVPALPEDHFHLDAEHFDL